MTLAVQTALSVSNGATGFEEFPTLNKRSRVKKKGHKAMDADTHLFTGGLL